MTGTAKTEEVEFEKIYGLNVFCVPTNKKSKRVDKNDLVYRTQFAKWKAVTEECKNLNPNDPRENNNLVFLTFNGHRE